MDGFKTHFLMSAHGALIFDRNHGYAVIKIILKTVFVPLIKPLANALSTVIFSGLLLLECMESNPPNHSKTGPI